MVKVENRCPRVSCSQVVVPEAETRAGLVLKPQSFPLTVTNKPVMDVAFVQFLASVSGKVSCLGKVSTTSSENQARGRSREQVSEWGSSKGGPLSHPVSVGALRA